MPEASTSTNAPVTWSHPAPPASESELLRGVATLLTDTLHPLGEAAANHLHAEEPRLGAGGEKESHEATRRSFEASYRELLGMLRAGIPAQAAAVPAAVLEHAEFLRVRGVPFEATVAAHRHGLSLVRAVLELELTERAVDADLPALLEAADEVSCGYVRTVLDRLAAEQNRHGEGWRPAAGDSQLTDDAGRRAARELREEQCAEGAWTSDTPEASLAYAESARRLERFAETMETAAEDEELSRRFSLADTSVEIVLAERPDLAITLRLDRDPIEIMDGGGEAEIRLEIASYDLDQLWAEGFQLPMAIARGRVEASGPVRKFLRVVPILPRLAARHRDGEQDEVAVVDPDLEREADGAKSFGPEQRALLDQAADYSHHSGAMKVRERAPGDFWSVECIDVHKAFGRNRVLNGLNVGIPDGMITVILGPSGTGKSVLIKHLIGLMFPDQGDILVHGRSVPDRRRSELFEMRREFGILFQDGALFGSMDLYDNVAFPLREQTNKSEKEIREIVLRRIEEVGLTPAMHRMPSELSGGMKKRAGFARALVMEPKIVMFDEPDSGLDPVRTALLCDLILKVHREHGGTYIVITHDIASARRLGQYIAVLWKGRIVESGDAEQMFNSENPFVRQFLAGEASGPLGME